MTKTSPTLALTLAALCMASPVVAKDKKPVDPNKKICRTDTNTGSIMPKSTCHTAAEWAAIDHSTGAGGSPTGDLRGQGGARPAGF
ncbi:hypothetical protein [uncultured Sphingomonas sp.]|uniref:hypothetical protein n=1 Tax=uncultured Sphingomonas sp. TaxID=158754 RepID=UPI0035CA9945